MLKTESKSEKQTVSHLPSGQTAGIWFALLGALLILCYAPMLRITAQLLVSSEDMAHGFFAPIIAAWLVWQDKEALRVGASGPSIWAIPILLFSALLGVAATIANSATFARFAFLIALAGLLLLVDGWKTLRKFAFPLSLLLFTFPFPEVLYAELTQPLQLLASRLSEVTFELLGYSVVRDGNVLQLAHMKLSVVEACSGLRSLVTLFFFCLVYGYFFEPRMGLRVAVILAAVPAAIVVNVLRITGTGILGKYNPEWTKGVYHDFLGWSGFFVGFALVLLAHWVLRRLFSSPKSVSAGEENVRNGTT